MKETVLFFIDFRELLGGAKRYRGFKTHQSGVAIPKECDIHCVSVGIGRSAALWLKPC